MSPHSRRRMYLTLTVYNVVAVISLRLTRRITAILISHFLLALQKANQMVVRLDPDDPLHSSRNPYDSTPSFVSSLGAFINPVLSTRSDGDSLELQVRPRSLEVGEADEDEDKGRKVQAMSA